MWMRIGVISTFLSLLGVFNAVSYAQTYGNASYHRLPLVKQYHTRQFDVNTNYIFNDYMQDVIFIPYVIGMVLFFAILTFEVSLCFRFCCKCCTCLHKLDNAARNSVNSFLQWSRKVKSTRECLSLSFFVVTVLCLMSCGGVALGDLYMKKGTNRVLDSTDSLHDVSRELESSGDNLLVLGLEVVELSTLALPTCPQSQLVLNITNAYLDYIDEYNIVIDPIPGAVNELKSFTDNASYNISSGLWSFILFFILLCALCIMAFVFRNESIVSMSLGCGLLLLHILLLIWCGGLVMLMVLSDFCMAPTDNAISLAGNDVTDVAAYYGTCNGTDPFSDSIRAAFDAVSALNLTVTLFTEDGGVCEDNPCLLQSYPPIGSMFSNISYIEGLSECSPVQHEWANIFNDASCNYFLLALYTIFVGFSCSFVFLFLLLIFSSLVAQYFREYWETGNMVTTIENLSVLNENLIESVDQLHPDGSISISGAVPASYCDSIFNGETSSTACKLEADVQNALVRHDDLSTSDSSGA